MSKHVCWINNIDYNNANQELRSIYDQVLSPGGQLDNLYRSFSLSPQTILPADDLYKATLHHQNNSLPKQFAELAGTYVAILAGCDYARVHHGANYIALSNDTQHARRTLTALQSNDLDACGSNREIAALKYVYKLCQQPSDMSPSDIEALREANWNDAEISELVQVIAMFSYFVRVIQGLGIQPGDEKPGLY